VANIKSQPSAPHGGLSGQPQGTFEHQNSDIIVKRHQLPRRFNIDKGIDDVDGAEQYERDSARDEE
jgi:hypothetical protein